MVFSFPPGYKQDMQQLWPHKGKLPVIGERVLISPGAMIVGDVTIGDDSSIWYNCVLRGDMNDIKIGSRTNIQDSTVIHVSSKGQGTYIGNEVTVGHMAILHACTIEDAVFIGMQACVMDDCHVETGAMVAAGALVTPRTRIPSGQLWAGHPAKFMRYLTENEIDGIRRNAQHYVETAQEYTIYITT